MVTDAAKITIYWPELELSFSNASGLRDALLASWPAAEFFNGPLVGVNRGYDIDTSPSWGWLATLVRRRPGWWPAIGIALQHAVHDGGDLARRALADLHATYDESMVLLEWTEPLAAQWPDALATSVRVENAVYKGPDYRLDAIVARQRALRDEKPVIEITVFDADGNYDAPVRVKTSADFEPALARTAKGCNVTKAGEGPWSWIVPAALRHEWLLPLVPSTCAKFADGSDHEVRALLDFLFAEAHDAWRYVDLAEGWARSSPRWWNDPANTEKPRGWMYPPRWSDYYEKLGDIAGAVLSIGKHQAATPPIVDLEPLFRIGS